jgi:NADP-dependent 3-hydroxy acid dehydrogenase YdfG
VPERAAIVTGASSGIGLAVAQMLGEEGHGLTVAARRPEKLAAAAEELRSATRTVFGRLDVPVDNAGRASARPWARS